MENAEFNGEEFLNNKYTDLAGSKPVERAVVNKRKEEVVSDKKSERVAAYMGRLVNLFKDERGFEILSNMVFNEYITKPDEIPDSYWKLQESIMREKGQLGDWESAGEEEKEEIKRQNSEGVLADQKSSLEQWLDYFHSNDSAYIPDALKYWIFRNIIKLQEFDKEKREFPKRSKGTVKQYPDINHDALAYVIDAILNKYKGKKIEFEYDIQEEERKEFEEYLAKEDFGKLYAWANELMNPIPEHLLPVIEGEWRKFDQGSDSHELVKTIRGKGTGWCTVGEQTAKTQLGGGDFYVYYSLDDEKKPTIPRIAIRMENKNIAEVRGIAFKQNLDPYVSGILEKKLEEFPDKEQYLKKERDMKALTEIEKKIKEGKDLSKEEITFIYELDHKIEGFGYQKDPRIEETRKQRKLETDLPIIFECTSEQIAFRKEDIKPDTKAYIGEWNPEVMKLIPEGVDQIYEKFPDKKVLLKIIETDPSIQVAKDAERILIEKGFFISDYTKYLLNKTTFSKESVSYDLVSFSVEQLGFSNGAKLSDIYAKAKESGLDLCPAEVGPQLRLQYANQPNNEYLRIAMDPILGPDGDPDLFKVGRNGGELWLGRGDGHSDGVWYGNIRFVFRRRK